MTYGMDGLESRRARDGHEPTPTPVGASSAPANRGGHAEDRHDRLLRGGFERLEPYDGKLSRTVLRGARGLVTVLWAGNGPHLPGAPKPRADPHPQSRYSTSS